MVSATLSCTPQSLYTIYQAHSHHSLSGVEREVGQTLPFNEETTQRSRRKTHRGGTPEGMAILGPSEKWL